MRRHCSHQVPTANCGFSVYLPRTRILSAPISAILLLALIAPMTIVSTGCSSSNSSLAPATSSTPQAEAVTIAVTAGTPQSAPSSKPFAAPFVATVTTNGIATNGEIVTFTAPASGASGTFANGTATETDVTDANGVATSSLFTANSAAGTFAVQAAVSGALAPVTYSLTTIASTSYTFYVSGEEAAVSSYYAVAGSIIVDSSGNVMAGEQDYNDGESFEVSPQPSGDAITGGTLTVDPTTGQGSLTLITNNATVGVLNSDGVTSTETFGVQFVNANHGLMMQFDGTATSSGSIDLESTTAAPSGNFAFTLTGLSADFTPVALGGVFNIGGTTVAGTYDVNDGANGVKTNKTWSGTLTPPDTYGRGTLTGLINPGNGQLTLRYYMVGPEAIRLIDVAASGSVQGSAFGQGTSTFSNASLGASVFTVAGNALDEYGAIGQFSTSNTSSSPADFSGVGDESEPNDGIITTPQAFPVGGTYSITSNGYGNMSIPLDSNNQGLGNITTLGIYMTDPTLNLNDPNNSGAGTAVGGALVVDLDFGTFTGFPLPGGTGMIVPQTDAATAAADFTGNYATGWQNFNMNFCFCEFDMIAQGTMAAGGSLSLAGMVSDPLSSLGTPDLTSSADTFTGIPIPDAKNPGRYSLTKNKDELKNVIDTVTGTPFQMVIYQANGQQLFWMDYDITNLTTVSNGVLAQQGSLAGLPATGKPGTRPRIKRK